ncbi:hypothetical protein [Chitinophaga barathri]|nr:hypothetical protein [Chitinophaga barathri]
MVWALIILSLGEGKAQVLGGLFSQKQTQLKRLGEQIAALRVYGRYLRTGYDIANRGLTTIRDIKNGDFSLHRTFFSGLKAVNPNILKYGNATQIYVLQFDILNLVTRCKSGCRKSGMYGEEDILYIKKVLNKVLLECGKTLDDFSNWATSGAFDLKDDERIQRIDAAYLEMLEHFKFTRVFCESVAVGSVQKEKAIADVQAVGTLYGVED